MAAAQKKVVVRKHDGELAWGYLPASSFASNDAIELMDPSGRITSFLISGIRWIAYVRDFNLDDPSDPERLGRKTFLGRPRQGGLWVRLRLGEDVEIEGVTDFDLPALSALTADGGLMVTPPDGRGNTLRLFVPRTSIQHLEVLGWIAVGAKSVSKPKKPAAADDQPGLFAD